MRASTVLSLTLFILPTFGCEQINPTPSIEFVTPNDGSTVLRDDAVTFSVFVEGDFQFIDPNVASQAESDEGHWHLNVITSDGSQLLGMFFQNSATVDLGTLDLPSGLVTFQAELRDSEHNPISNAEADVIELVIQ